jgi:hypothetical protein
MARQRENRFSHFLSWRHEEDPEPNRSYTNEGFYDQWNKVTRLYKPTNTSEVREFLSKSSNFKIIDYLIKVYTVIVNVFQSEDVLLELFQDPEIVENRHLVALIGVHLPSKDEIVKILAAQNKEDTTIPPFDDVAERLDTIIEWWLNTVPRELLDIVYFDIFDLSNAGEVGRYHV